MSVQVRPKVQGERRIKELQPQDESGRCTNREYLTCPMLRVKTGDPKSNKKVRDCK